MPEKPPAGSDMSMVVKEANSSDTKAPPNNAITKVQSATPKKPRSSIANKKLITIETPPPRGVGMEWELRSLGTSITLLASAYLRKIAVSRKAKAAIIGRIIIKFIL